VQGINELLKRADIVDVIGSYIELKRSGSNYIARCPFHPDDTPSLSVSPSKGIWKCFGCGVGGDVIKFVAMYENISYWEALLKLAKKYNVNLNITNPKKESFLHTVLEEVATFYHENLRKNKKAIDYLKGRGLSSREIQAFKIGFSPSSEELVDFLKKKDLLSYYEKTKNLIKISESIYKDIFANRIVIPIRDTQGKVVAFGARAIDDTKPRYINSPESEIFKKSEILFNLDLAKDYIREKGYAIVVEGYFDVISLYAVGFKNAIAPLGTAFTESHAKKLSNFTKEVILLFDGDEAGQRAVFSSLPHLLKHGISVKVAYLPVGEDPDSLARNAPQKLRDVLNNSEEIFKKLVESTTTENVEAIKKLVNLIGYIPDKIHQEHLLKKVSKKLEMPVYILRNYLPKIDTKKDNSNVERISYKEKIILKAYMQGVDVPIDRLMLSPNAMLLLEDIKEHNWNETLEEIKNLSVKNLDTSLSLAIQELSVDNTPLEGKSVKKILRRKV